MKVIPLTAVEAGASWVIVGSEMDAPGEALRRAAGAVREWRAETTDGTLAACS